MCLHRPRFVPRLSTTGFYIVLNYTRVTSLKSALQCWRLANNSKVTLCIKRKRKIIQAVPGTNRFFAPKFMVSYWYKIIIIKIYLQVLAMLLRDRQTYRPTNSLADLIIGYCDSGADLRWGSTCPPLARFTCCPQIQKLADHSDVFVNVLIFGVPKYSKMQIFRGSAPDPAEGAYSAPPGPLADGEWARCSTPKNPTRALGPSASFLQVSGVNPLQNWQP